MPRIPELGLDDGLPGAQWAREAKKQMITASAEPGIHRFERLPSYEGDAGMCVCGWQTPEPSYESMGLLANAIHEHLERDVFPPVDLVALRKEADFFRLGKLIGYHRLVETTEEHGTRHIGWLMAGERGSVRFLEGHKFGQYLGQWIPFDDEQQGE
ncbi:hypothetical protein [Streptomyces sp. NPDC003032]